ncbi:MAG: hypothetical protein NW237_08540 [Cyanobacteriota bacterium]|nr:hypothetical protein [Cyanobacteriota bacterium]
MQEVVAATRADLIHILEWFSSVTTAIQMLREVQQRHQGILERQQQTLEHHQVNFNQFKQ